MKDFADQITFGPYSKEVSELSYRWLSDPEIAYLTNTPPLTKEIQQRFFKSLSSRNNYHIWVVLLDLRPIGCFGIKNILGQSGEYWGFIGEKDFWGRGIGRIIVNQAVVEAKNLGLAELTLEVIKSNTRAFSLYMKCGFNETSCSRDKIFMKRDLDVRVNTTS